MTADRKPEFRADPTNAVQFRLEPHLLAELDLVAQEMGCSRNLAAKLLLAERFDPAYGAVYRAQMRQGGRRKLTNVACPAVRPLGWADDQPTPLPER